MVWKIVGVALVVLIILFSFGVVYQNIPREVVEMKTDNINGEPFSIISYGATPVFLENLRFNHNDISYFIGDSCSSVRRSSMIEAFGLFSGMTKYIRFNEVGSEADIDVECSDESIEIGAGLFAAGEGGPSRIINTSRFKVIEKGSIFLYSDSRCERPVVELHELGHVFGFDHSEDPLNIMYNTSGCEQRISDDMVELIYGLYSVEALADVRISELVAVKRGKYLDFNMTILNDGMLDAGEVDLSIVVDGDVVEVMYIGEIEIGFGRTLCVENLNLGSRGYDAVEFHVDRDDVVEELDEENNVVLVSVESS